jgi:hypothetical protein
MGFSTVRRRFHQEIFAVMEPVYHVLLYQNGRLRPKSAAKCRKGEREGGGGGGGGGGKCP